MKVFVGIYTHKHGVDVSVYSAMHLVREARQQIADEWWDDEMPKAVKKPDERERMADTYFDYMARRGEFFDVSETFVVSDASTQAAEREGEDTE